MTSTSPIQVVGEQEMKQQGTTDIVDLMNTLPQVFQNTAADFSNTPAMQTRAIRTRPRISTRSRRNSCNASM